MNREQIGLDQICSIGGQHITVDPKKLICSICFCINIDAKECKNKKCLKLFCNNCYEMTTKNGANSDRKNLCPFCRTGIDCAKADESLLNVINNLNFFCMNGLACDRPYSFDEFAQDHLHLKISISNVRVCIICKVNEKNNSNLLKCSSCQNYGCFQNLKYPKFAPLTNNIIQKCLSRCFNCKITICLHCRRKKPYDGDFLCGLCDSICKDCGQEGKEICDMCKGILCSNCFHTCDKCQRTLCKRNSNCFEAKVLSCIDCKRTQTNNDKLCIHEIYSACSICYGKCLNCNINKASNKCNVCLKVICSKDCSVKCRICLSFSCSSCTEVCSICKRIICRNCARQCTKCRNQNSLISCLQCQSDTIRSCNYTNCHQQLCLNCWNVCNTCGEIYCSEHSNTCINCEESMCEKHFHSCAICSKKENFKKLCLKRCTFQCSFCLNITNAFCKPENHKLTMVSNYNCDHNICKSCVKSCAKCHKEVVSCPKCIVNYYFTICKFCDSFLCSSCGNNCNKCEDISCTLPHKCSICERTFPLSRKTKIEKCINCEFLLRLKCSFCKRKLDSCSNCRKIFICSRKCYIESQKRRMRENQQNHQCEMYTCNEHIGEEDEFSSNNQILSNSKVSSVLPVEDQRDKLIITKISNPDEHKSNPRKCKCCCSCAIV